LITIYYKRVINLASGQHNCRKLSLLNTGIKELFKRRQSIKSGETTRYVAFHH
jgi:hypothetical protein